MARAWGRALFFVYTVLLHLVLCLGKTLTSDRILGGPRPRWGGAPTLECGMAIIQIESPLRRRVTVVAAREGRLLGVAPPGPDFQGRSDGGEETTPPPRRSKSTMRRIVEFNFSSRGLAGVHSCHRRPASGPGRGILTRHALDSRSRVST